MREPVHDSRRFAAGFLMGIAMGALAGGLIGLASAPARGETMRRALRMRYHRLSSAARARTLPDKPAPPAEG